MLLESENRDERKEVLEPIKKVRIFYDVSIYDLR